MLFVRYTYLYICIYTYKTHTHTQHIHIHANTYYSANHRHLRVYNCIQIREGIKIIPVNLFLSIYYPSN